MTATATTPTTPTITNAGTAPATRHKLFVNIPVADLQRSIRFFEALGFRFNPQFTDATATTTVLPGGPDGASDAESMWLTDGGDVIELWLTATRGLEIRRVPPAGATTGGPPARAGVRPPAGPDTRLTCGCS